MPTCYQIISTFFYSGKAALLVNLETNSLLFRHNQNDLGHQMIRALFGDGCSAVVMSAEAECDVPGKWAVQGAMTHTVENTSQVVKYTIDQEGIDCLISKQLPIYVQSGVRPFVDNLLSEMHIEDRCDIDAWGVHPGGTAILRAVQTELDLNKEDLKEMSLSSIPLLMMMAFLLN